MIPPLPEGPEGRSYLLTVIAGHSKGSRRSHQQNKEINTLKKNRYYFPTGKKKKPRVTVILFLFFTDLFPSLSLCYSNRRTVTYNESPSLTPVIRLHQYSGNSQQTWRSRMVVAPVTFLSLTRKRAPVRLITYSKINLQ